IGGGDRLSSAEPGGAGKGRISDGFNKVWDLGAGIAANRDNLPSNNGLWPNLLRLNVTGTNTFLAGEAIPLKLYYQYGSNTAATADLRVYLDPDPNPLNNNSILLTQTNLPSTGTNAVGLSTLGIIPNPATVAPGTYSLYATIAGGTRMR